MTLDFSNNHFSINKNLYNEDWQIDILAFIYDYLNNDKINVSTSGSTGKPKNIFIKKVFMKNSAQMTGDYFNLKKGDSAFLCLPIQYIAGKMMIVRAIELGLILYCVKPDSSPLENLNKEIDFGAMVPLQIENSINKLNLIKNIIIGGAPISLRLEKLLQTIKSNCYATYGMTETVTHIAIKPLNHQIKSKYFTTLSNITIKKDNRGCLVIDCPKLSSKEVITNDIVNSISNNQFEFIGRFDNVINSGGVKLHPERIEKKLSEIISDRFIITSIPDERLGQKLILIIESTKISQKIYFNKILDKLEIPKHVFFTETFIETKTGKINRNETIKHITHKKSL